jgi:hypothetical protein
MAITNSGDEDYILSYPSFKFKGTVIIESLTKINNDLSVSGRILGRDILSIDSFVNKGQTQLNNNVEINNGNFQITNATGQVVFRVDKDNGRVYQVPTPGAVDPVAADIEDGTCLLHRNTTSGEVRFWFNNGGALSSSASFS